MVRARAGLIFVFCSLLWGGESVSVLVDVKKFDFSLKLDIELAKKNGVTGERVYAESRCVLRSEAAKALSRVQAQLKLQSFELLLKDCYRPVSLQKKYEHVLKESSHTRGGSLDVELIDKMGAPAKQKEEILLVKAMRAEGFVQSKLNFRHFDFKSETRFSELDFPLSTIP